MNRRRFLYGAAASLVTGGSLDLSARAAPSPPYRIGIASTAFSAWFRAGGQGRHTAMDFLEHCHALGAGGIQTRLDGDLGKLRSRAEETGMFVEAETSLPKDGNLSAFEKALQECREVGAPVMRVAALAGRRYETFADSAAWNRWKEQTLAALKLAVPVAEKWKVPLALENHKDWTVDEQESLLRSYSSEHLGVCLDFGNNLALLDDPMETIERLAPYALSTHVKDMGVQPYEEGFLLSEVLLGEGFLDLPRMVATIQKARPKTHFVLEMITRDPLKVPCLTEKYWAPFPDRNGRFLARTLKLVRERASRTPLPAVSGLSPEERLRVEEQNIRLCLRYSHEKLSL